MNTYSALQVEGKWYLATISGGTTFYVCEEGVAYQREKALTFKSKAAAEKYLDSWSHSVQITSN